MTTYDRDPLVAEQQHRVEETRAELGATVEALASRANVRARAQQKAGQIKSRAREKTPDAAARHPLVAIAGVGAAAVAVYAVATRIRTGSLPLSERAQALQRSIGGPSGMLSGASRRRGRMRGRRRAPSGVFGGALSRRAPIRRGNALQRALGITPGRHTRRMGRGGMFASRTPMRRGTVLQRAFGISPSGSIYSRRMRGRGMVMAGPSMRRGGALQRALGTGTPRGRLGQGGPWFDRGSPWFSGGRSRRGL